MTALTHIPYVVRDLGAVPHERPVVRGGETEDQYFKRLASVRHRHERTEKQRRIVTWLLG
jgi:hypothetical protein